MKTVLPKYYKKLACVGSCGKVYWYIYRRRWFLDARVSLYLIDDYDAEKALKELNAGDTK